MREERKERRERKERKREEREIEREKEGDGDETKVRGES